MGAFQLRCGLSDIHLEAFPRDHLRDIFAAVQPASHRHPIKVGVPCMHSACCTMAAVPLKLRV